MAFFRLRAAASCVVLMVVSFSFFVIVIAFTLIYTLGVFWPGGRDGRDARNPLSYKDLLKNMGVRKCLQTMYLKIVKGYSIQFVCKSLQRKTY